MKRWWNTDQRWMAKARLQSSPWQVLTVVWEAWWMGNAASKEYNTSREWAIKASVPPSAQFDNCCARIWRGASWPRQAWDSNSAKWWSPDMQITVDYTLICLKILQRHIIQTSPTGTRQMPQVPDLPVGWKSLPILNASFWASSLPSWCS